MIAAAREDRPSGRMLLLLGGLCLLAYLPLFRQPLLEDDWPLIEIARGWQGLLFHSAYRYRMTFWMVTAATESLAGVWAPAFYVVAIAQHVLATWLVYAMGRWSAVGWRVSAAAAVFFAVYEGHQEAVMWYAATFETLMFLFGVGALLCWLRWAEGGKRPCYAAAVLLFLGALASKESAVIFVPLMLLVAPLRWKALLPFAALAGAYALLIFGGHTFRTHDGSFSLRAPFWITWPVSYWRMLWVWGLLALVVLAWRKRLPAAAIFGLLWMGIALIPYIFLTYMQRVPSRQTYLASAGLALLVGAGFHVLRERVAARAALAVALVMMAANIGYLWTRKREQFLERAAPTVALIAAAREAPEPVYVQCFPLARITAEAAVRLSTGKRVVWEPEPGARPFCYQGSR